MKKIILLMSLAFSITGCDDDADGRPSTQGMFRAVKLSIDSTGEYVSSGITKIIKKDTSYRCGDTVDAGSSRYVITERVR